MDAGNIVYPPYLPDMPANGTADISPGPDLPPLSVAYPHGMRSMSRGTTIYDAIRRLGAKFEEVALAGPSLYVRPATILYEFDGKQKRWDIVEALPSVGIVLYHTGLQCFLLVRQFRPPVYGSRCREAEAAGAPQPPKAAGFTYELCAGLIDKAKSLKQIAREEVLEEVGYDVPVEQLQELSTSVASAGTSGALHYMYFAQVDESMRAQGAGGGLQEHGECIEVMALPLEHALSWALDNSLAKSPGALFGVTWGYHAIKTGLVKAGGGTGQKENNLLTEELTLKPVLPA